MKVQVLYVAECPTYPTALKLVKDVLAAQGVSAEIQEVLVRDERMANELGFLGSPTIRVNGRDVVGEAQKAQRFALCCRLYSGSNHVGLPPPERIRAAIIEAQERGEKL